MQQQTALPITTGNRTVFVVALSGLLAVSALPVRNLLQLSGHHNQVAHAVTVVAQANQVMIDLLEVQSSARGYIITGDDAYLQPYRAAVQVVAQDVRQLRQLTLDNPVQQQRMTVLEQLIGKRLDLAEQQVALRQTRGYATARQSVVSGSGKALMDQTRVLLRDFTGEEDRLLAGRSRQAQASARNTLAAIAGLGVLALLMLVLADRRIRRDMARRNQAERERDRLFNYALDMYCIANFDGYFKQLNPAWEKTLGWSTAEMLAVPYMQFVHPDDREATTHAVGSLRDGKEVFEFDNRYRCKDGGYRWLSWVAYPLVEEGLIFSIARDITARKQQEAQLLATNGALQFATQQARAADRAKSAFLATMSHELRTPLNAILGFSEIMRDGVLGPVGDKQHEAISSIFTSGTHLLALINDLLDLSKIEAGQIEIMHEPFDLPGALQHAVEVVTPLAEKKGLSLRTHIAPDLGRISGDRRRIEQILLNLLGNAVKFTEQGGVTLSAQRMDNCRLPGASSPQPAVCLRVTDTGMGIKAEDIGMLFQPFQQLDSTFARNHEGTGLGLAICRRLAELMGGAMQVESVWGQGSTFSLILPLHRPD